MQCEKAKTGWLEEGDANTHFFHLTMVIHHRYIYIDHLMAVDNTWKSNWESIGREFSNFYTHVVFGATELRLQNWNWKLQFQFFCLARNINLELELNSNSNSVNSTKTIPSQNQRITILIPRLILLVVPQSHLSSFITTPPLSLFLPSLVSSAPENLFFSCHLFPNPSRLIILHHVALCGIEVGM